MPTRIFALVFLLFLQKTFAQPFYFPPNQGNQWDTLSPTSLGWCTQEIPALYDFLEQTNTKAFVVLKDGKIVLEKYFDTFTQDSLWYWASAGKTMTAFLVGMAQQENYLDIDDKTSDYLGTGWTSAPPAKEDLITLRHQLQMTTGLDDSGGNLDCTLDTCLTYLADAGTRWSYHNAPYTLLGNVIENATNRNLNVYVFQKLTQTCGLSGFYTSFGYNKVFVSTPRSMARFGLLMLNNGAWGNTPVMTDSVYFNQMINTSQPLNQSYGYLWWLNGKQSFMAPGTQITFPGMLCKTCPPDQYSALGKNGQILNVVPSQNLVMVRMGSNPDNSLVPFNYNDSIWEYFNRVNCGPIRVTENNLKNETKIYPNPAKEKLTVAVPKNVQVTKMMICDGLGRTLLEPGRSEEIEIGALGPGVYFLMIETQHGIITKNFMVIDR